MYFWSGVRKAVDSNYETFIRMLSNKRNVFLRHCDIGHLKFTIAKEKSKVYD